MSSKQTGWIILKTEPYLWTVGCYDAYGKWHPESDHDSSDKAAQRVNYLNGEQPTATEDKHCTCEVGHPYNNLTCPVHGNIETEDKSIEQMAMDYANDLVESQTIDKHERSWIAEMWTDGYKANTVNAELLEALKELLETSLMIETREKAKAAISKAEQLKQ